MLTFEQMKELLEMVAHNDLSGVEISGADFHFRVEGREVSVAPVRQVESAAAAAASPQAQEVAAATVEIVDEGHLLTSPIVGTFYTAPSPEASPYVTPGDRVVKGQVVCIIEAMKLMNEIEADASGVVTKVFPQNGQPVEFGERLFAIEAD